MEILKKTLSFPSGSDEYLRLARMKSRQGEYDAAIDYYYRAESISHDNMNYYHIAKQLTESDNPQDSMRMLFEHFPDPNERPDEVSLLIRDNYRRMHEYLHERIKMVDIEETGYNLDDFDANSEIVSVLDRNELILNDTIGYGWDISMLDEYICDSKQIMAIAVALEAEREMMDFYDLSFTKKNYELFIPSFSLDYNMLIHEREMLNNHAIYVIACITENDVDSAAKMIMRLQKSSFVSYNVASVIASYSAILGSVEEKKSEFCKICEKENRFVDDLCVARILINENDFKSALKFARRVFARYPYLKSTNHMLGLCLYSIGDYAAAYDCYERILKMFPNELPAKQYLDICKASMNSKDAVPAKVFPESYSLCIDEAASFSQSFMKFRFIECTQTEFDEIITEKAEEYKLICELAAVINEDFQLNLAKKLCKSKSKNKLELITTLLLNSEYSIDAKNVLVDYIAENEPERCVAVATSHSFVEAYSTILDEDDIGNNLYSVYCNCFDKALYSHGAVCSVAVNELFRYFSFIDIGTFSSKMKKAMAPCIHTYAAKLCGFDITLEDLTSKYYDGIDEDTVLKTHQLIIMFEEEYIHEVFGDL